MQFLFGAQNISNDGSSFPNSLYLLYYFSEVSFQLLFQNFLFRYQTNGTKDHQMAMLITTMSFKSVLGIGSTHDTNDQ
jgi:hypothetical protein